MYIATFFLERLVFTTSESDSKKSTGGTRRGKKLTNLILTSKNNEFNIPQLYLPKWYAACASDSLNTPLL
jgi:hypothetical protein